LGEVIDEVGSENIPGAVATRLKEFGLMEGKQTKLLTLREAEKLRKLIGNNMPGQKTPTDAALAPLRSAIDEAVDSMASTGTAGAEAVQALEAARGAARQRFQKIESIPALSDMLQKKQIPPEDFVETYVIRGSNDEVKSLVGQLPPGARRDVRAAVDRLAEGESRHRQPRTPRRSARRPTTARSTRSASETCRRSSKASRRSSSR
jgi:hypothetical protein